MKILLIASLLTLWGQEADKKKVACTIPVIKSIADEIGGEAFETFALAKADEDMHRVSPTPIMMNKLRKADLFLQIGFSLETWSPEVTNGSGNAKIFPGGKANVAVTRGISPEDVPAVVSRAEGDIHPEGNPHVWLDPLRARKIAENIADAFKEIHPSQKEDIGQRLAKFTSRIDDALFGADLVKAVGAKKLTRLLQDGELWKWLDANEADGAKLSTKLGGWLKKAEPLRGVAVIEFHRSWVYLAKLLGFEIVGAIEEKPGIEPGPKHLLNLVETIKTKKAKLILVDNFYGMNAPQYVAEKSGAKVVVLPNQPTGEANTTTYFAFVDHVITKMVEGLK